jgi:hypothetical protein
METKKGKLHSSNRINPNKMTFNLRKKTIKVISFSKYKIINEKKDIKLR